ncbi:hypothetical protein LTR10_020160 [Elasticomyces elasticus]|nr:hypothetical protein LTR10_020160 [Elasticomyces elasticus]
MAQTLGWRWPFLLQCPLVLIGALLVEFKLQLPSDKKSPTRDLRQKLNRIDFAGAFFLSSTILGALTVLDLGGQKLPWSHPAVIGAGFAAAICSVGFFFTEKYFAAEPIFPLRLITHYVVCTSYLMLMLQNLAIMAMMFVVPMYYQVFKHASTGEAGSYLVLSMVGNTIGGVLTGWWIGRTRRYKFPLILGSLCSISAFLGLISVWKGQTDLLEALLIFPVGLATGVAHSAIFIGLSAGVDSEDIAIAGSGLYLSSNVGMVAGVSLGNVVYQVSLRRGLRSALQGIPDRDTVRRLPSFEKNS